VGRRLPVALRAFLLTLAVVDDLGAITVIAVFYTDQISFLWLGAAGVTFALYALAMRMRVTTPFLYIPLVLVGWYCTHESGVHATIAGVVFGFLTRVRPDPGEAKAPADRMSHLIGPISAGICVPLFAFFSAGVDFRSVGFLESISTPVAIGIIVGLVVGKPIGVLGGAWLTARFTRATLTPDLAWRDVGAIGVIAGIGFTVALLISELAYETDESLLESAKVAVLTASVIAALLAGVAIRARNRHYSEVYARESADEDGDGIPDVYQSPDDR
jgi:NhaA family Na+:H+ antiporter